MDNAIWNEDAEKVVSLLDDFCRVQNGPARGPIHTDVQSFSGVPDGKEVMRKNAILPAGELGWYPHVGKTAESIVRPAEKNDPGLLFAQFVKCFPCFQT